MLRFLFIGLAALSAASTARAQARPAAPAPGQPIKIAFINSQQILRQTPGWATAESTYLKEFESFRTEMQKLQQQLDSAVQAFDQAQIALSPAARQTRQRELQAMQQRMEQRNNQLREKASQREQELLQPIQARVNSVIQGIRAEMNFALILDADAPGGLVVAADPALNITARVLQRLQQAQ